MVSFNQISSDILTPGQFIEYDSSRAVRSAAVMPNVVLMIGQRLTAGTIPAEVLTSVSSAAKGSEFFGHGSILASMIETYKNGNPYTELWAVALDDIAPGSGGVAATGTFTWSGTATEDGIVYVYIAGHRIPVTCPSGTAAAALGPLVVAAITAYVAKYNVPVSAGGGAAVTTITCLHNGTLGNGIDLRLNHNEGEALPAGITCVIVDMASGAADPDVQDAIDAMGDTWYTTIVSSLADDTNQDKLEAELLTRWHPYVQQDCLAFIGCRGTQGTMSALGAARNNKFTVFIGGGESPTPAWLWASAAAAVDTGETDPARPRQTLSLVGMVPPKYDDRLTRSERNTLLSDGISTFTVDSGGVCRVERLITTYVSNAAGVTDTAYRDVCTMRTLAYIRYSLRARIALRFPRHKLADDGTNFPPSQAIVTPAIIASEILALFKQWEEQLGIVEGWEQFRDDLLVERDASDVNRVNVQLSPDLMNQFRVFAGQIQFLL